jgi:LysR family cys regulon transcriptional activator
LNIQQLRIVRETVRRSFNLTEVSAALFTSQSGVSKHIKSLEEELGVELFIRRGKRLIGLTEPGKEVAAIVERMLADASSIRAIAGEFAARDVGRLTVATTHTQARYALPKVVTAFKGEFPKVHLVLHETSPREIVAMLREGQADIGVATEALADVEDFIVFPYYTWRHAVVVPKGHPLTRKKDLSLADIAAHPIVTYRDGFTGRASIDRAFEAAGVTPDIVMSALDADVIKTYVEAGLGIGIVASMAFVEGRDSGLEMLDAESLFDSNTTVIALRRGQFLRGFAFRFMALCSPDISEEEVRERIA